MWKEKNRMNRKCFRLSDRLGRKEALALYLAVLGMLALWADRSEIVLGCIGALLTLLGYGPGGKQPPPSPDGASMDMHSEVVC